MYLMPKNIKSIFLVVLPIKLHLLAIDSANQLFFINEEMQFIDSLQQFSENINLV